MLVQSCLCVMAAAVLCVGCASSGNDSPGPGGHAGSSAGSGGGGSGNGGGGGGAGAGEGADGGQLIGPLPADAKGPRGMRCDDSGRCTCFNIASIGQPGHTGFQGGMGNDSTNAFVNYLNTQSSASVDMYTAKPTLTSDFLNRYDVLIFQWLVDGVSSGGDGTGYWTFAPEEINALKDWVNSGGGVITLSGYDAQSQEVMPLNQVVQALTDMSYGTADVLGTVSTANYCLGESDPLSGWVQTTPIGKHVTEVGAFHGRPITPGPKATVDCSDSMYTYAAHEDVGQGHVFAYSDEWVTYTSQWLGIDAGASCVDASAAVVYQVPQFWYNAISYAAQATACPFMLNGAIR
ncbi:MAG TPA: hypothetical protein VKU41_14605 [Polyangiaceae bacterium]|nr:hypothetical protein [Polyangiaceae bacterium]